MGREQSQKETQITSSSTSVTESVSYLYNLDGSVQSVTYPSGRVLSYAYAPPQSTKSAGRMISAIDSNGPINYATGATYAPPGELASSLYGVTTGFTGIATANSYNDRLQPAVLSAANPSQTIFSLSYGFNPGSDNGNVKQIVNNLRTDATHSVSFTYDPVNRILQANTATTGTNCWGEAYNIDTRGNLWNISGVSAMTGCNTESLNNPVNANNQITGWCYDGAGNLLDMGACGSQTHAMVYDAESHLQSPNTGLSSLLPYTYYYDGDGNRVQKCDANPCTSASTLGTLYWRSVGGEVLDESSRTGAMQEEYVYLNGQRVARRDVGTNSVHYYFADHLGSPRVITDSSGNVQQQTDYYPYGGIAYTSGSDTNNYKFTGKERDIESGLDNFGARYNASSMGRFMTPDPLGGHQEDPQTLNKYSYVRNNPLNLTDPTGLDWYLGCTTSDHAGCAQLSDKDKTWVQADANGNATVVTSDSIRNGDNSATVDQNGVQITTGGNTYQGVYYDNPASKTYDSNGKVVDDRNPLTVQGDASKGFGGFTFNLNGNCGNTCLASGSFTFAGTPEQAKAALNGAGAWDYGFWDALNSTPYGHHPYSQQFRFGAGPSSHFSVPDFAIPNWQFGVPPVLNPEYTVPATGGFHVDAQTGSAHGLCANLNIGCGK